KSISSSDGRTGRSLAVTNVGAGDAATYSVVISGTCDGSVTNFATLTLNQNVLVSSPPVSLTNCPGTTANFSVSATGTGLSYQWLERKSVVEGQSVNTVTR